MPDSSPSADPTSNIYHRLRRLQAHSRSNLPAMILNRASSTFTLHSEPQPTAATARVLVIVYPQDPFVGEPEVRTMDLNDISPGLINPRVRVDDSRGAEARPDNDGNYLFWPGDPRFDQVNAFYYTTFTLRMYERYARRALPWSFPSPRLTIDPGIGRLGNAFYNEQSQTIGFHEITLNGDTFNSAWSADIVSHEAAHAVLDGLRDLYNESFGLGPGAFHESFADMTAMLVALHDDSLIRRLLDWTDGDLQMDNFIAQLAEQLTDVLKQQDITFLRGHTVYLRNAINDLRDLFFDDLPYRPQVPEFELGRQNHNYSRLFTGAFYDILVGIYDYLRYDSPNHIAIYRARDVAARLLVNAVELGPVGELTFADMAQAFLAAESILYNGRFQDILISVFAQRRILSRDNARQFLKARENLPSITLPPSINSAMASALFLEEQVQPALNLPTTENLIPLAAYRNAAGWAFLTYFSTQRIRLEGEEYGGFNGATVDLFGGLSLMFDPENRLCSVFHRPVTAEDARQTRVMTLDLINEGLIMVEHAETTPEPQTQAGGVLIRDMQSFTDMPQVEPHIVRWPAIIDPTPTRMRAFVDYLHDLRKRREADSEQA
jgi:hypothetical protein